MPTSFEKPFGVFLNKITDNNFARLDKEEQINLMFNYLTYAKIDFKRCQKNLQQYKEPDIKKIIINCNNLKNLKEIECNELYSINDIYVNNQLLNYDQYIINNNDNKYTIYFLQELNKTDIVIIKSFFLGQFNDELTEEEYVILGECMVLHWLQPLITRLENLKVSLGDRDFKMASTSNAIQLEKNLLLRDTIKKDIRKRIVDYSYNPFYDSDI